MIEMQRLQYTQSRNLNGMKSRKNTKIVYTCEQLESFFFLTWSPKYIKSSSLWYGVSSCGKGLSHLSKYTCKYKQHHSGMNGKYDILLLNNFIIQFQSDLFFFSTEIVDYRSCH